jgi:hypothetical protein
MKPRVLASMKIPLLLGSIALSACATSSGPSPAPLGSGELCSAGAGSCNEVSGYSGNSVADNITGATVSGGGSGGGPNQVIANFGAVGGGQGNVAGEGSTVGGGYNNQAIHFRATVGGGSENVASAQEATVSGGLKNTASQRFATVGGGSANVASDIHATVGGGSGNVANYQFTTVGGGTQNLASNVASVVAGGEHNLAQGAYSTVAGGLNNNAEGYLTAVLGGAGNSADGAYSLVAGGFANTAAGDYSLAAGRHASVSAKDAGTFLFADANGFDFPSLAPNEFAVRATGGVRLVTGIDEVGAALSGVRLSSGSGSWESLSDVNSKSGFASVDGSHILDRLMSIPISTWYYRSQGPSVRHIGPMAQDFQRAFRVGDDGRYISTVDEDGVALAAIQELYRLTQRPQGVMQPEQIVDLESRLAVSNGLAVLSLMIAVAAWWRPAPKKHARGFRP